jgi:hypothetical protein
MSKYGKITYLAITSLFGTFLQFWKWLLVDQLKTKNFLMAHFLIRSTVSELSFPKNYIIQVLSNLPSKNHLIQQVKPIIIRNRQKKCIEWVQFHFRLTTVTWVIGCQCHSFLMPEITALLSRIGALYSARWDRESCVQTLLASVFCLSHNDNRH